MAGIASGAPATVAHEQFLQRDRTAEQDLALVGEITEEGSLGEPGATRDLGDRGLFVPALHVQLEGRLRQPALRVWLPSAHALMVVDDSN